MDVASLYSIAPDYLAREYDWNASGEASGKNDGSFGSILDVAMNIRTRPSRLKFSLRSGNPPARTR